MRVIVSLVLASLLCGCLQMTVVPTEEGPRIRLPKPFEGEEPPALEATDQEGLYLAPLLAPNVYFHEAEELWYRYAYRSWYQAFRWNGNWFVLDDVPPILANREIIRPKLPELPGEDDPRDVLELPDLPELPELPPLPGDDEQDVPDYPAIPEE